MITDRVCGMSGDGFCTFHDARLSVDSISDGEYVCPGCNETTTRSGVEPATEGEVEASRKAQDPGYGR